MSYHYSKKVQLPFDEAVAKVTETLQEQGFGIITTIDVKETLRKKLDIDFRNYKILGACNPDFARRAIEHDSYVGVLLPCNVVVQEHKNGQVELSAINPMQTMDVADQPGLKQIASVINDHLHAAIDTASVKPAAAKR